MEVKALENIQGVSQGKDFVRTYAKFDAFLSELRKRELPDKMIIFINKEIDKLNQMSGETPKKIIKQILKSQSNIISNLEKELNIVPKKHYLKKWMVLGMGVLGIPAGLVVGVEYGRLPLGIAFGLPIGMLTGTLLGFYQDKKAFKEGRQINVEL